MKFRNLGFIALAILTVTAWSAGKAQTTSPLLVTTSWLARHLNDKNLVLLHVGDKKEYDAQHIPGARYISLRDISVFDSATGLGVEMPAAKVLHDKLAGLGISSNSRVIVYYANEWITVSTRVIFTLSYAGLGDNASLLDGGMQEWTREHRPVTDKVPELQNVSLAALSTKPALIVDGAWVKAHLGQPGVSVVDARAGSYYDGTDLGHDEKGDQRRGHIAGAKSLPFSEVWSDDLKIKSIPELEALFAKAGVKPGDTVVSYCHIGGQATGVLFAARLTGHPVMLYDGSFEDWSAHASYPVETKASH